MGHSSTLMWTLVLCLFPYMTLMSEVRTWHKIRLLTSLLQSSQDRIITSLLLLDATVCSIHATNMPGCSLFVFLDGNCTLYDLEGPHNQSDVHSSLTTEAWFTNTTKVPHDQSDVSSTPLTTEASFTSTTEVPRDQSDIHSTLLTTEASFKTTTGRTTFTSYTSTKEFISTLTSLI